MSVSVPHSVNPIVVLLCCDGRDEKQVAVHRAVLTALGGSATAPAQTQAAAAPAEAAAKGKTAPAAKGKATPAAAPAEPATVAVVSQAQEFHPLAGLVKVLGPTDLFEKPEARAAAEVAKKLKSLISIKSEAPARSDGDSAPNSPARARAPCVYVLSGAYPETLGELQEVMAHAATSSEFPIIDGIINLISRGDDSAKSSLRGPDSAIVMEALPESCEDASTPILKSNIETLLRYQREASGGVWHDVTFDEIDLVQPAETDPSKMDEKSTQTITKTFIDLCLRLCGLKSEYKSWSATRTYTEVPLDAAASARAKKAVIDARANNFIGEGWKPALYSSYLREVSKVPVALQDPGAVLFSMIEALSGEMGEPHGAEWNASAADDMSVGSLGEKPFFMLKQEYLNALKKLKSNIYVVDEGDEFNVRVVRARDVLLDSFDSDGGFGVRSTDSIISDQARIVHSIFSFETEAVFRAQVPRLVGQGGMPLKPSFPLRDRTVKQTELLTFTSLSNTDFFRFHQMLILEDIVRKGNPPRVDFTGTVISEEEVSGAASAMRRQYFKPISAFLLPQILAKELMKEPLISKEYYPLTDELLVSMYWPPPKRRQIRRSWDPTHNMHLRTVFDEFLVLEERGNFTPRTAASVHNSLNIPTGDMKKLREDTLLLTPADKSTVLIKNSNSAKLAWMTVHHSDSMFGMRHLQPVPISLNDSKAGQINASGEGLFFVQTEDDVRINVFIAASADSCKGKPDGKGTVCVTLLTPNSLCVTAYSSGSVSICHKKPYNIESKTISAQSSMVKKGNSKLSNFDQSTSLSAPEYNRMVCCAGVILRYLEEGGPFGKDVMFLDGSRMLVRSSNRSLTNIYPVAGLFETLIKNAPENWTLFYLDNSGGVFYSETPITDVSDNAKLVPVSDAVKNICSQTVDAQSRAVVREFKDGRVFCSYTDGCRDVYFPDGTRFVTHSAGNMLLIEKIGYPKLEVDLEIDRMSYDHSRGKIIPLAKGGDRARTKISMPDGSAVFVKYDTRITSPYNGSVRVVRRNRAVILAIDGGFVDYKAPSAWTQKLEDEFVAECKDVSGPESYGAETRGAPQRPETSTDAGQFGGADKRPGSESADSTSRGGASTKKGGKKTRANVSTISIKVDDATVAPAKKGGKLTTIDEATEKNSSQAVISSDTSKQAPKLGLPETTKAAKYIFDLNTMQCIIEDHENNVFEIDLLRSPLEPRIILAGEVGGLKPTAVAVASAEPRLFVISRSAEAVELCRFQEIEELDLARQLRPSDFSRFEADAVHPPCNLSGGKQITYFCQKRSESPVSFSFDEVFAKRPWFNRPRPAALSISLRNVKSKYLISEDRVLNTAQYEVHAVRKFLHIPALSAEGYRNIKQDYLSWQDFGKAREKNLDKYTFEDPRSEQAVREEAEIQKLLKAAYKAHKQNLKRERERLKKAARAAGGVAAAGSGSFDFGEGGRHALPAMPEGEEGGEDEDGSDEDGSDDDHHRLTPEEVELAEAFSSFAETRPRADSDAGVSAASSSHHQQQHGRHGGAGVPEGTMGLDDAVPALVQVLNRFVTPREVDAAYYDSMGVALEQDEEYRADVRVDFELFKKLYQSILFLEERGGVPASAPPSKRKADPSLVPPLALATQQQQQTPGIAAGEAGAGLIAGSLDSHGSLFGEGSQVSGSGGDHSLNRGSNAASEVFPAGSGLRMARSITKSTNN